MDTIPFLFFLGLLFIVVLGSVSGKKGPRRSSDRLPGSMKSLRESDRWVCPSCVEMVEATSDTCPWCGWTDVQSEDATPTRKKARVEEVWVSEPVPEPDGVWFSEPLPESEGGEASSEVELDEPGIEAPEAEETREVPVPLVEEGTGEPEAAPEGPTYPDPPGEEGPSLADAVQAILAEGIIGGKRDRLVKSLIGNAYSFELTVEKVERPISMFLDPDFRNGRIVSGVVLGTDIEVSVVYPNVLNDEVDTFDPGSSHPVRGTVKEWDRLRMRPIIRILLDSLPFSGEGH